MKVNHLPPGARGLGMVFQSYALYPHMTIAENLSFGLRMAKGEQKIGADEIKSRVQEAAGMLELLEHLDKKPMNHYQILMQNYVTKCEQRSDDYMMN